MVLFGTGARLCKTVARVWVNLFKKFNFIFDLDIYTFILLNFKIDLLLHYSF